MRRSTGAILRETRPETIITSACRGLARKTSAPKRARSLRDEVAFIISIAQQARPNVAGQSEDLRAQLISESSRVVSTSGNASARIFSKPIKFSSCSTRFHLVRFCSLQKTRLSFTFAPGFFAPIESAFLQDVYVTCEQKHDKQHHLDI